MGWVVGFKWGGWLVLSGVGGWFKWGGWLVLSGVGGWF